MSGVTHISPQREDERWPFRAHYVLLSKRFGDHTLSARFDWFTVDGYSDEGDDDGGQTGHASTLAYIFQPSTRWKLSLEWVHFVSTSYNREEFGQGDTVASQTQVQLAVRCALESGR